MRLKGNPKVRHSQRWTKRKYWVERSEEGYRICSSTYDGLKEKWCEVKKEPIYQFVAIGFRFDEMYKIYVHRNLHESIIRKYLLDWSLDQRQVAELNRLINEREFNNEHSSESI